MLRDLFQVEENEDYAMGAPLKPINLGVEQPQPGNVAITAAHRAKRGIFHNIWDAFWIHNEIRIILTQSKNLLPLKSYNVCYPMESDTVKFYCINLWVIKISEVLNPLKLMIFFCAFKIQVFSEIKNLKLT